MWYHDFYQHKYTHIYKIFTNMITIDNWFKKSWKAIIIMLMKKRAKQTENQQLISDKSEN